MLWVLNLLPELFRFTEDGGTSFYEPQFGHFPEDEETRSELRIQWDQDFGGETYDGSDTVWILSPNMRVENYIKSWRAFHACLLVGSGHGANHTNYVQPGPHPWSPLWRKQRPLTAPNSPVRGDSLTCGTSVPGSRASPVWCAKHMHGVVCVWVN